jgi:prevent-host-death family protein
LATVGAYEAKTHLPKLLERVAKGETITITKHGKPIAELRPLSGLSQSDRVERAFARLRELRKGMPPDPDGWSLKDYVNYGRRF